MIMIRVNHNSFPHGPDNAEHELKKAYNCVIEAGVTHFWSRRPIPGVNPYEVVTLYKNAMEAYRENDRLTAERWARCAKHLARATWHEAKISYLEPRPTELPFLGEASEEFHLHEQPNSTADLLNALSNQIPAGMTETPEEIRRYLLLGKRHLTELDNITSHQNELLKAERIKAAHEYGRTVECLLLVYEATASKKKVA